MVCRPRATAHANMLPMLTMIQDQTRWATPRPLPQREMREKPGNRRSLFSNHSVENRPKSVHTEFMGTDWELEESESEDGSEIDSEGHSEIEDDVECGLEDGESSPRISVGSVSSPTSWELSSISDTNDVAVWTTKFHDALIIR